jgi:hypothetical protein
VVHYTITPFAAYSITHILCILSYYRNHHSHLNPIPGKSPDWSWRLAGTTFCKSPEWSGRLAGSISIAADSLNVNYFFVAKCTLLTFQVHVQIKYITTYSCTIQSTFLRYICNVPTTHDLVNCIFMYISICNTKCTFCWYIIHILLVHNTLTFLTTCS